MNTFNKTNIDTNVDNSHDDGIQNITTNILHVLPYIMNGNNELIVDNTIQMLMLKILILKMLI